MTEEWISLSEVIAIDPEGPVVLDHI